MEKKLHATTIRTRKGGRLAAIALAGVLAVGLVPAALGMGPQQALAADEAVLAADPTPITGGDTISANGTYQIEAGASGTITVNAGLNVTVIGQGADSANMFSGLTLKVNDGAVLTIRDFGANQSTTNNTSTIDFTKNGTLNIEGANLIDNDGGLNAAVIHVPYEGEVHFTGTGTLYGYKSALCSYIGGNNGEANGKIVFDSGYWFLKGTKTGAVIGGDSTSVKGNDIIINGGELYVKGVARGALIGGSNQGISGDVIINGGLLELFEDFSGPAIGAGNTANVGNLIVNGGSIKTVLSSNSANSYGAAAEFGGMPGVSWKAVKAANAADYALLFFDASAYLTNLATDTVSVKIDGKDFYSGRGYTYVTNEVKNPTVDGTEGAISATAANWLTNDEKWYVDETNYGTSAYPDKSGSSFVVDKNLYFALSKENHTITAGDDTYQATWVEPTEAEKEGHFDLVKTATVLHVGDVSDQAYTGKAIEPAITVTNNGTVLTPNVDYAVSYENNVNVGTATVNIAGLGDYLGATAATEFAIYLPQEETPATEVSGTNRYATAQAIVNKAYPAGAEGVIVATGANFPDALAASSLAGALDWPIVLTESNALSKEAASSIESLKAKDAIIVGGTSAVSDEVAAAVGSLVSGKVERISGGNRYETADKIHAAGAEGWSSTAIIATGENFADALAISGYAFKNTAPIFLVNEGGVLTQAAKEALAEDGYTEVYILGGEAAVSTGVDTWVKENVGVEAKRLKGENRYETSKAIADFSIQNGCTANGACIATGDNFPDALAGGVLVGKYNTVLLLADPDRYASFDVLTAHKDDVEQIYFLGGENAVPSAVRTAAKTAADLA